MITAHADTDDDNVRDANEPQGTAAKTWVVPASTPGCKVTYGGRITAASGDKGHLRRQRESRRPAGQRELPGSRPHHRHARQVPRRPGGRLQHSRHAGQHLRPASIDGSGSFNFRIDLKDAGEPGSSDTYRIRLSTGYDSGEKVLEGGNVQIH